MKQYLTPVCLVSAVLLLLAPFSWPYGYYQLLRIVITASAIWLATLAHEKSPGLALGLVVAAIVYNPLLPIYLDRDTWLPINLVTGGLYLFTFIKLKPDNR